MADLDTPRIESDGDITEKNSLHVSENLKEGDESPLPLMEQNQNNQSQDQANQQESNLIDPIQEALQQLQGNSVAQQFELQKQIQRAKLRYIIPNHVDQTIARISTLKNIYEFQGIQSERWNYLNKEYSHFRAIRNDGNQQFRAVGFAVLESFIRASDNNNLDILNNNFKSNQHQFRYNQLYQDFRNKWINQLEWILSQRKQQILPAQIVQELIDQINNNKDGLDDCIIQEMRHTTANFALMNEQKAQKLYPQKDLKNVVNNEILRPFKKTSILTLLMLANSLEILIQMHIDITENYPKIVNLGNGAVANIFLLYEKGKIYILYPSGKAK